MRISVITAVLDRSQTIGAAIESVARQIDEVDAVQHIIVDGGSSDGTLEVIAQYPHLELVRESRRGIYVAFNRGLREARNDVVCFVNSDDLLEEGALARAAEVLQAHPETDVVAGRATLEGAASGRQPVERLVIPQFGHQGHGWDYLFHSGVAFNAHFFRRSVWQKVGPFDERYRFAGDREMLIRMKLAGVSTLPVDRILYRYLRHKGSATLDPRRTHYIDIRREHIAIADRLIAARSITDHLARKFSAWKACECARIFGASVNPRSWAQGLSAVRSGLRSDSTAFIKFLLGRRNWS